MIDLKKSAQVERNIKKEVSLLSRDRSDVILYKLLSLVLLLYFVFFRCVFIKC